MFLKSIAHSVPERRYTQPECWSILENSGQLSKLRPRSVELLRKLLNQEEPAVHSRHFAMPDMNGIFGLDAGALNHGFEREAPTLARQALEKALDKASLAAGELDALFICTCTGYLCPGVSSHVAEQLQMEPSAYLQDLVGLGCGAAIPTLRSAAGFCAINPEAKVAVVAVEICSAAFFIDDDPGVLVSLCLFGDGASASIWQGEASGSTGYRATKADTIHMPEARELLRFGNCAGKLRNQLSRNVPEVAAKAVSQLWNRAECPPNIVSHGGGREVLEAIKTQLQIPPLASAHDVLHRYGNLSSPAVLVALEAELDRATPQDKYWLTSFGAGFSAHSIHLERT